MLHFQIEHFNTTNLYLQMISYHGYYPHLFEIRHVNYVILPVYPCIIQVLYLLLHYILMFHVYTL